MYSHIRADCSIIILYAGLGVIELSIYRYLYSICLKIITVITNYNKIYVHNLILTICTL